MSIKELLTKVDWMPKSLELFLSSLKNKKINLKFLMLDIFAGSTVGIVALPLAMAFAIASGVSPEKGIFTAIVGGLIISVLSGSRYQIGGPTGAFVIIILGVVGRHGYAGLVAATLLAGVFLIIFGLLKVGNYIKYIPYPVTAGFTAGIGFLIFTTQVKDFFGLTIPHSKTDMAGMWLSYLKNFLSFSPYALAIGVGTVLIIFIIRKTYPKIPAQFVAVGISCLVVYFFDLHIATIGSKFGGIPSVLPYFTLPDMHFETFRLVLPDAVTIAFLAGIESLLCAVVADGMTGDKHHSNTELIAQGVGNIGSAFFGGIPVTGAIARTATSIKAGAKSPFAGVVHALILILFIAFFAPVASYIPLASLAGVLIIVAWDMSELHVFARMFHAPKSDLAVLLLTFLLTVFADLTVAVQFGMVLASVLFMKRMSDVTKMSRRTALMSDPQIQQGDVDPDATSKRLIPKGVEVYEINGPFFFGVADKFSDEIGRVEATPKVIIIRMRYVPAIDATGIFALESFILRSRKVGTEIVLSGVKRTPKRTLIKMG
ncbi:MAG: SulP family inorganic anion transporter, partial [bacterium]